MIVPDVSATTVAFCNKDKNAKRCPTQHNYVYT